MDVVISYVNQNDPEWFEDYKKYNIPSGDEMVDGAIRYRDWGLLKYVLRSIDKNMPFVRKIHLIVERPSQIPDYINTDEVHVVYHKDFIPEELLPTYNSRTIEMLMHRISGLDEEFVYFNDDMLITEPLTPEELFKNGKPCITYTSFPIGRREWGKKDVYYFPHLRCSTEAARLAGKEINMYYLPNHGIQPQLKSNNEFVYNSLEKEIYPTLGRFRTPDDYIHYIYNIYLKMLGKTEAYSIQNKYLTNNDNLCWIRRNIIFGKHKQLCLNDVFPFESEEYENFFISCINKSLDMIFPNISKYEKRPDVAVCCIVKNENKYLGEWINHYLNLGFSKIYIYDNNDINGEVVNIEHPNVVIVNFRGRHNCQILAYNHCINSVGHKHNFIAFFDADEFLELNKHRTVSDWIAQEKYKGFDVIKVNWLLYGDNNQIEYKNEDIQTRFPKYLLAKEVQNEWRFSANDYVKSIVRIKKGIRFVDSVHVPGRMFNACNTLGEKDICFNTTPFVYSDAVLKHYRTKSLKEYIDKINRGYPDHFVTKEQRIAYLNRYFYMNERTPEKETILADVINGKNVSNLEEKDLYFNKHHSYTNGS